MSRTATPQTPNYLLGPLAYMEICEGLPIAVMAWLVTDESNPKSAVMCYANKRAAAESDAPVRWLSYSSVGEIFPCGDDLPVEVSPAFAILRCWQTSEVQEIEFSYSDRSGGKSDRVALYAYLAGRAVVTLVRRIT